jgi:hypothetical protein
MVAEASGAVVGTVGALAFWVVTVNGGTDDVVVDGTLVVVDVVDVVVEVGVWGGGGGTVTGTVDVVVVLVVDVSGTVDVVVVDVSGTVDVVVVVEVVVVASVHGTVEVVVDVLVVEVAGTVEVVVVVGVQHFTVVVVSQVGCVVVVHQPHVVVGDPPLWWAVKTAYLTVVVVVQFTEPLLLWLVVAFEARAGSATRLSVTTATTASADRELLSIRVVVARHIPTNCRKVNVWPSPRIMRTFFFIWLTQSAPARVKRRRFPPFLSSHSYFIALTLIRTVPIDAKYWAQTHWLKGFRAHLQSEPDGSSSLARIVFISHSCRRDQLSAHSLTPRHP